jgi:hypothetical protein
MSVEINSNVGRDIKKSISVYPNTCGITGADGQFHITDVVFPDDSYERFLDCKFLVSGRVLSSWVNSSSPDLRSRTICGITGYPCPVLTGQVVIQSESGNKDELNVAGEKKTKVSERLLGFIQRFQAGDPGALPDAARYLVRTGRLSSNIGFWNILSRAISGGVYFHTSDREVKPIPMQEFQIEWSGRKKDFAGDSKYRVIERKMTEKVKITNHLAQLRDEFNSGKPGAIKKYARFVMKNGIPMTTAGFGSTLYNAISVGSFGIYKDNHLVRSISLRNYTIRWLNEYDFMGYRKYLVERVEQKEEK